MLSEYEIENGMKANLGNNNATGLTIEFPNSTTGSNDRPYMKVRFGGGDRRGGALKGQNQIETVRGFMTITLVYDEGDGTSQANQVGTTVAELFTEGDGFDITNGKVYYGLPSVKKGFRAENKEWRVPVIIPYHATRI